MQCLTVAAMTGTIIMSAGCSGGSTPTAGGSAPSSPSSSPAQPEAVGSTKPTEAPPAGYQWQGTATQRIWVAIPKTWVALNLAKLSLNQVTERFATKGIGTSQMRADLIKLKQDKALFFADLASYVSSAHGFTTNASALCPSASPIQPGSSAIPGLESEMRAEYAQIKARVLSMKPLTIVGGQAFESRLSLTSNSGFVISELQVVALSRSGRTCFVTFSTDKPAAFRTTFSKSAATIHVG